ncbi:MAG: NAD(+)/NADH kinase [Gemmatales bacterium]|nr:NAD(+)/NADH kinase [Gemmatales bacterium]
MGLSYLYEPQAVYRGMRALWPRAASLSYTDTITAQRHHQHKSYEGNRIALMIYAVVDRNRLAAREERIMRLWLLGNGSKPGVAEWAERFRQRLQSVCTITAFDLSGQGDLSQTEADLALVVGGDGAILRAARQMGYQQRPVLGVNLGRLGFLAEVSPEEFLAQLDELISGRFRVTKHVMYECTITGPDQQRTALGLNEIVVYNGPPFRLIEIELYVEDELAARYGGDGFILSTPIGSTAHNLSAGGPILHQELAAFVVTFICPHMLTNRSLVDRADKTYRIRIPRAGPGTTLILDGQDLVPLSSQHTITVRQAPVWFQLVHLPSHRYYRTLRDKLHWSLSPPG